MFKHFIVIYNSNNEFAMLRENLFAFVYVMDMKKIRFLIWSWNTWVHIQALTVTGCISYKEQFNEFRPLFLYTYSEVNNTCLRHHLKIILHHINKITIQYHCYYCHYLSKTLFWESKIKIISAWHRPQ